ncbi:MAG: hypothetical protein L0Y58_23420, partial [Verrucomicrobia subdivision 3 bacterium]|nr:hypothetical protein [Limisphaerales bacterium]
MIRDTISKIESRLQGASAINEEARAELLQLVGELRREISNLDEDQARSIAGLTHDSTDQIAGEARNPELLKRSIEELS